MQHKLSASARIARARGVLVMNGQFLQHQQSAVSTVSYGWTRECECYEPASGMMFGIGYSALQAMLGSSGDKAADTATSMLSLSAGVFTRAVAQATTYTTSRGSRPCDNFAGFSRRLRRTNQLVAERSRCI